MDYPFVPERNAKLFCGGLSFSTTKESMEAYFSQYGDVMEAIVVYDKHTRHPRGFGFVSFRTTDMAEKVVGTHHIDGMDVEVKFVEDEKPRPKEGDDIPSNKIFVGGIGDATKDDLIEHFGRYGRILEAFVVKDRDGNSRNFGYVTFDTVESAEDAYRETTHVMGDKVLNIKRPEKGSHPDAVTASGTKSQWTGTDWDWWGLAMISMMMKAKGKIKGMGKGQDKGPDRGSDSGWSSSRNDVPSGNNWGKGQASSRGKGWGMDSGKGWAPY
eukprot:TRINITY_DN38864_c0_g1_i1.p1 TRINITY_DN38864_c0_g1~~TRINITY_DN38864_c0_g1_i1.p1  ORF type:complete len:270 (+),score=40.14 TRINITY_DN38864_c0_g1_i1:89-898(+)